MVSTACYEPSVSDTIGPCLQNVLLAMIIADQDVDPDEVTAAEQAYDDVVGQPLPQGELARTAAEAQAAGRSPIEVLRCLPSDLTDEYQHKILSAAFRVASADGFVLEEEDDLLKAVAKAIGMDGPKARAAISRLMG